MRIALSILLSLCPLAASAQAKGKAARDYKLRPGDLLEVFVYPQTELNGKYVVGTDGALVLPTVGRVPVGGVLEKDIGSVLTREIARLFREPKVTVNVVPFSSRHIIVTGQVVRPGVVSYSEGMTISDLVVSVGGFTEAANREAVLVQRGQGEEREPIVVDVQSILAAGPGAEAFKMQAGDIVEIPLRTNLVYAWGAIMKPGSYLYTPDLTLFSLVAQANGVQQFAKNEKVRIFRKTGEVMDVDFQDVLDGRLDRDVALRPGDVIIFPWIGLERTGRFLNLFQPFFAFFNFGLSIAVLLLVI